MPSYLVETYLARSDTEELEARNQRATEAAEALSREQTFVSFERSIHVLPDEICLFLFTALSEEAAARAAQRAGLDPLRIVQAVSSNPSNRSAATSSQ
jgi:hypothetical protein